MKIELPHPGASPHWGYHSGARLFIFGPRYGCWPGQTLNSPLHSDMAHLRHTALAPGCAGRTKTPVVVPDFRVVVVAVGTAGVVLIVEERAAAQT
ncbi:MAG: hypothetical protein ABW168_12780 [Sedimenticola sp.]